MSEPLSESALRSIGQLLLTLHEKCHELPLKDFQREALALMQDAIPCEAALLATGTFRDGMPGGHDIFVVGRPAEFMQTWERVRHEDPVSMTAMQNPERSHIFDLASELFDDRPAVREHCREYRIAHILCTATVDQAAGVLRVLSLCREHREQPFSERERSLCEWLAPHVFAAERRARVGELYAHSRGRPSLERASAFVDPSGLVLESEPRFFALLTRELPHCRGPELPPSLWPLLRDGPTNLRLSRVALRRRTGGPGVSIVEVRELVAADQLTDRERQIAESFSSGLTHREIGESLAVSPNTVRRHLANVYEKLGIGSKAELDRMLRAD